MFRFIGRFVAPYKRYLGLNILFNLLSTLLSLCSFAAIIPVLQILFDIYDSTLVHIELSQTAGISEWLAAVKNNIFYWVSSEMSVVGSSNMLLLLGLFLVVMTMLKCLTAWLASYFMVPIRTGVVADLRMSLYKKTTSLPIGFFTDEHKGDIMSRMTNDVAEVENSIMASLDMIFKDPIMIIVYLTTLFVISWQLTLFVLILLPISGWLIGKIGRSLKRKSTKGQEQTGSLLTQIEETLGGLRVVKAFNAENKLITRFAALNSEIRKTFNNIHRRYALAHPVSEFLGTILIAVLLWFGGSLILSDKSSIDAAEFIYYLVIFYSIINPAKDLTRASYSIRKGMASMERIDKILQTENNITEPKEPVKIDIGESLSVGAANSSDKKIPLISYRDVSFSYDGKRDVLSNICLDIYAGQTIAFVGQSGSGKTT
ncbi:MAG: ABC transporter ATP-binding protein, partial [Paludibacteraceae bacterium]|nr:ABC transporter ATP-binding protein [Paludibacteraceae bacterium]